jgi:HAD superfamily hydrolase (TIGR01509 family)
LFDIEGTLVDAVPLTLRCWQETLREFGYGARLPVLQQLSGMNGPDMLARLVPEADGRERKQIVERQGERFQAQYLPQVRPLPGAAELVSSLRRSGRKIGLATDCTRDELKRYVSITGIADYVDAVACGSDARRGKPHADLVRIALQRLDARSRSTVFVGDTPSDAEAARRMNVATIGLLTGGFRRCDLEAAGCRVFSGLESLRDGFERLVS